jgi:hypothetical protein
MTRTEDLSETEITPEMIEAGFQEICILPIEPDETEMRATVRHIFRKMFSASPQYPVEGAKFAERTGR